MLEIPYVGSSKNACALACYTMVAKYYFPEITFDEMSKISDWQKDYVVWPFKFWNWIMDKGIAVRDYELLDYEKWANKGIEGLKETVSEKEFEFYQENTKNLESYSEDIKKVLENMSFEHRKKKPEFEDLISAYQQGSVCEVVLDSKTLDGLEGFSLHRVVILEATNEFVTFHDPQPKPRPKRKIASELFKEAWLEVVSEPELCIYRRFND